MYKHRGSVLQVAGGGRLGRRGLPYLLLFQVLLTLLAPVVDIAGLYMLMLNPATGALTWLAFLILQLIPAIVAFRWTGTVVDVDLAATAATCLSATHIPCCHQSAATALAGSRMRWHKLTRIGNAVPSGSGIRSADVDAGLAGLTARQRSALF
jgi:hypothetical protein